MVYEVIGHILNLVGIFFAFLAVGFCFIYAGLIKGGVAGKMAIINALGYLVLAFNIFFFYGSAATGRLNSIDETIFWPLLGFFTVLGFSLVAYSQYKLWEVTSK